ncbi:Fic family protein [Nitrosomonas sp. Nm34]|uniref:Fic/DOC family protein n=1 Tax=Nitrosomonas sp. Nm34 TaxID=1881055 RepID=UPI001587CAF7|nr:Fic family protein [Nitrosomonas sp. Nm34]
MDKYDAGNDYYCYPDTSVLKNKLGITDEKVLEEAEREITAISINYIKYNDPPYNLEYLKKIHSTLFSELYDWAGEIRNVDISKGGTRFCIASRITPEIEKIFSELAKESYLATVCDCDFAMKLSEYYAEFNVGS